MRHEAAVGAFRKKKQHLEQFFCIFLGKRVWLLVVPCVILTSESGLKNAAQQLPEIFRNIHRQEKLLVSV